MRGMKAPAHKLDEIEVLKDFPITGAVPGWYFRTREASNCHWVCEGTDLWGRRVGCDGFDDEAALAYCYEAARRIIKAHAESDLFA